MVRVAALTMSLDGFVAGPDQSLDQPLGVGGGNLHGWMVGTRTFLREHGLPGEGTTGVDDDFTARGFERVGAWIIGRNMFGPIRGPWPNLDWAGWWGPNPPYHVPVFVLTHHERPSLTMEGGTVFHFVTAGFGAALDLARAAAGSQDVRVGGGAATVRQYLQAGLIDELHMAIAPILLGRGEPLLAGLDLPILGYKVAEVEQSPKATHVVIRR